MWIERLIMIGILAWVFKKETGILKAPKEDEEIIKLVRECVKLKISDFYHQGFCRIEPVPALKLITIHTANANIVIRDMAFPRCIKINIIIKERELLTGEIMITSKTEAINYPKSREFAVEELKDLIKTTKAKRAEEKKRADEYIRKFLNV